jgi:hypothetical protein
VLQKKFAECLKNLLVKHEKKNVLQKKFAECLKNYVIIYRKLAEEEYTMYKIKANVQKINKSEKNRAAAQLVETGSKLDQNCLLEVYFSLSLIRKHMKT